MGKKGFKVKTYEPPDERFVVIVNAWGKTRDRQQFTNAVGAWFEVMLRRIYPKQKLQVNCIYYQSTHDILIVELPSTVTSLTPFLGAHPYRSFLTINPTSTEFAYIYEYDFKHFNHPENTNWHASMPNYREIPRNLPVKDPYPLPREIEGIGMLPTPPPPMNARYAIPVPVPPPQPPAPVQETRCSPAPAPPPRPSASSSGSSSTTPNLPREAKPDIRSLDPRKRPPSSAPAPAPPLQPPQASTSTKDSLFTPYDPPSHHPTHSTLTTARSGGIKGKERELPLQPMSHSSIGRASSLHRDTPAVDDFLSSILPPPLPPSSAPTPPPVQVKAEENPVKLEEAVRIKPEPQDDHDPALFASPPPPTYYPSPTTRPLRIKAEPLDDSIPPNPSFEHRTIKPESSEADEDALAGLQMMMPPPPLPTRVKPEPIDDDDIDLGPSSSAAMPSSSRGAGYVRSQSEMWVKQELLLDPSRMRRSESVLDQPASEGEYDPESGEGRAEDQEDEREERVRPDDKEDDYQPSAELLDAFASLEGEMGLDLFGAAGMEVDSSSQTTAVDPVPGIETPGRVTVKPEPTAEEDHRAYMNDSSDRRSTSTRTLPSETRPAAPSESSENGSARTPTWDPRQTQTPSDPRRRINVKEEPRDEYLSALLQAPTSHRQESSSSSRRTSIGENQRHSERERERERSLTMPGSSSGSSRDGRRELVKIKSEPRDDMMIDSDRRSTTYKSHNQSSYYGDPRRTPSRRDGSESEFQRGRGSGNGWRPREDNAGRKRAQNDDPCDGDRGGGARGVEGKDERQGSNWGGLKFKRTKREPA